MHAGEDKYVVLLSGLNIGSSISNPLKFQLLVDHITGHLGDEKVGFIFIFSLSKCLSVAKFLESLIEQEQGIAAQIVHVVICGNSVEIPRAVLNGQVEVSQTMYHFFPLK